MFYFLLQVDLLWLVLFPVLLCCPQDLRLQLQTAPSGLVCDSLSLPSYKEYPAQRPFITTLVQSPTAQTYRASSPCKAFPETNSAGKCWLNRIVYTRLLINHLASAESRCLKLEKQLDQTRKMSADQSTDSPSVLARLEKLDHLEQEYLRLTHTQNKAERKIHDLELKLQEEEHQRKLVENKANLLQVGLETNRILLQSVSPYRKSKDKESKKSSLQQSPTEPHYKFRLRDVPFVAGTSVGNSHSVRANVQSVLSLLKCHQPHLCNSRVLSNKPYGLGIGSQSFSSSSSSSNEDELSDLLHALQEELRLMSLEQEELLRKVERSVSEQERKDLQREQEKLLLKMERKGEQINKLYKHKSQVCDTSTRKFSSRGHSTEAAKLRPGERSRRNLRLLKDMRALQMSLQT
uniref:Centrosomal protein 57 n=1 Tax=Periophthalmus magnuspinnatus TaxID=409849 RepID=A0A3B4A3L9_9GOBI